MELDDSTYELIDQYLQGKLPEDHPFVQRLKEEDELAQEVELQRLTNVAILNRRLLDVEELLESRRSRFITQNSKKWKWVFWSLPILIIGTVAYLYTSGSKQEIVMQSKNILTQESVSSKYKLDKQEPISSQTSPFKTEEILKEETSKEAKTVAKSIDLETKEALPLVLTENTPTVSVVEPERKVESIHQKETTTIASNPCLGIRIKAYVEEERPCRGTAEGQLRIRDTKGGKAPYQFSLEGKRFQQESKFGGLKADEYDIVVKDANNCETVIYEKYALKYKSCVNYSEHIFNPNLNSWEVPNNQEKRGEVTIFDENGNVVYFHPFDKLEKINWGGVRTSGELLASGIYIYNIKYLDGVVEQGKITITY